MQVEQVKEAIEATPKGANIIIEWTRNAKTKKACVDVITKSTRMVGRIGIEYDNMGVVQEKRENGELPAENNGLPWGEFEIYPYLIAHKDKKYVRLYKGTSNKVTPKVVWHCNGEVVEKSSITDMLLSSEKKISKGDCFVVKVEDVTRLHTESNIEIVAEAVKVEAQPELVEA